MKLNIPYFITNHFLYVKCCTAQNRINYGKSRISVPLSVQEKHFIYSLSLTWFIWDLDLCISVSSASSDIIKALVWLSGFIPVWVHCYSFQSEEKSAEFAGTEDSWDFLPLPERINQPLRCCGLYCWVSKEISRSFPQVLCCICQLHGDVSAGSMWHLVLIREQLKSAFVLIYVPESQSLQSMIITILWVCVIKRLLCLLSDDFRHFIPLFSVLYHHNHNFSHQL